MNARNIAVISLNLFATILIINSVNGHKIITSPLSVDGESSVRLQNSFTATTPPNFLKSDDSDDDENSLKTIKESRQQSSESDDSVSPLVQIFNVVTNAMLKSAATAAQQSGAHLIGLDRRNDDESVDDDNDNVTENANEELKEVGRASYIQGDPLNGYYDFVITEGSYKFWVVFQLATAALLIYSTLAAIYYSKVNPLTSDYEYTDYLSRSFHGGSFDTADVDDDDDDEATTQRNRIADSGRSYLSSLSNNLWFRAASYGFQFALDAIDKVPQ